MIPRLVTPPVGLPVTRDEVKTALALDGTHHDQLIDQLIVAATGYLDGWDGALGRAILPQTWAVTVQGEGPHLLPLPDVTAAESSTGLAVALMRRPDGFEARVSGATGEHEISFTCGLSSIRLPSAQQLIRMLVGYWYEQRLPVSDGAADGPALTSVQRALIHNLRWDAL